MDIKMMLSNYKDTEAILKYIAKDLSWRKFYFSQFTIGQKMLFFLPVFFFWLPIYGTYSLFTANSWTMFLICGVLAIVSIWAFSKQKAIFEKKVFRKQYQSDTCKSMFDFELEKFSLFLGEQNTVESRIFWKNYFKKKQLHPFPFIMIVGIGIFAFLQFGAYQNSVMEYFLAYIAFLFLLIALTFIHPALTDFKFKAASVNGALKFIDELDKRAAENEDEDVPIEH
jgi:hypothetical protein